MIRTLRRALYRTGLAPVSHMRRLEALVRYDEHLSEMVARAVDMSLTIRKAEIADLQAENRDLRAACDEHARDYERLEASYRRLEIENRDLRRAMAEAVDLRARLEATEQYASAIERLMIATAQLPQDEGPPYPDARSPFEAPFRVVKTLDNGAVVLERTDGQQPFDAPCWPTEDTGELRVHHGSIADCPICRGRHPDPRSGVGPVTVISPVLGRPTVLTPPPQLNPRAVDDPA